MSWTEVPSPSGSWAEPPVAAESWAELPAPTGAYIEVPPAEVSRTIWDSGGFPGGGEEPPETAWDAGLTLWDLTNVWEQIANPTDGWSEVATP